MTTVMDMPNVVPQTVTLERVEEKLAYAASHCHVNHAFFLGATNDNIQEIRNADPRRIPGIKLFMGSSTGNMLVDKREQLERIFRESPMLVMAHCEDTARITTRMKELELRRSAQKRKPDAAAPEKTTGRNVIRVIIAAAAVALIVLGVMNGGMFDVLVKAINICTECIGLG